MLGHAAKRLRETAEDAAAHLGRPADRRDPVLDAEAMREAAERGLNLLSGSADDGWHPPDPIITPDGNRLTLFKDGEAARAAYRAIERAKHRVLLEVYIWPSDETGRMFADLLAVKARAGVRVFVIYDGFGSLLAEKSMFDTIRKGGGHVLEFHPFLPWRAVWGWRPFTRDHRKILVVDSDIAGLGGLNVGNRYAGNWVADHARVDPAKMWRDAGVGIVGPAAASFARSFGRTWRYLLKPGPIRRTLHTSGLNLPDPAKGPRIGKSREVSRDAVDGEVLADGADVGCLASAPTLTSPLRPFLHELLRGSRHSIEMTMAYFAPDDELVGELCDAARRGVRVRLMLAGRSDATILIVAARAFYARLLEAGCEVYERQGAMLHQKSIVVDGRASVLGSTNLDYRSIEFNLEVSAVVRGAAFAGQLAALFDHDASFARRIEASDWRDRPYRDRLIQAAVSRARYLL